MSNDRLKELILEEENAKQKVKLTEQKLHAIQNKRGKLERNARTHQLCTHGAMLEAYLPSDDFTDGKIAEILRLVFRREEVKMLVNNIREAPDTRFE